MEAKKINSKQFTSYYIYYVVSHGIPNRWTDILARTVQYGDVHELVGG